MIDSLHASRHGRQHGSSRPSARWLAHHVVNSGQKIESAESDWGRPNVVAVAVTVVADALSLSAFHSTTRCVVTGTRCVFRVVYVNAVVAVGVRCCHVVTAERGSNPTMSHAESRAITPTAPPVATTASTLPAAPPCAPRV